MLYRIVLFLIINFSGLAIGSYFTKQGVSSYWYQSLNKAPWTPPGWVFGVAWTTIMICFAVYMAYAYKLTDNTKTLIVLFVIQWLLNALWNPIFFHYKSILLGLIVIVVLTILIITLFINNLSSLKIKSLLIMPYVLWLLIATSLNAYILFKN